jgi:DNA-binding CsgD family transcriptional regulator
VSVAETATHEERLDSEARFSESLSWRETQVLALIANGATDREIAATLFLAESTVSADVRRLRAKLDARNRAHAVAIWFRSADSTPGPSPASVRIRAAVGRRPPDVEDVIELLPDLVAQMFGGMVTRTGRSTARRPAASAVADGAPAATSRSVNR